MELVINNSTIFAVFKILGFPKYWKYKKKFKAEKRFFYEFCNENEIYWLL